MKTVIVVFFPVLLSVTCFAQSQTELNLMPMPAQVQPGTGTLAVTQSFSATVSGAHDPALDAAVGRFTAQLSRQTGIPFRPKPGTPSTLSIHTDHGLETAQKLGEDETYQLRVTDSGAQLAAPTTLGALRGLSTFLQLVTISPTGFVAPAVTIKDQPRFPWRGLFIDV